MWAGSADQNTIHPNPNHLLATQFLFINVAFHSFKKYFSAHMIITLLYNTIYILQQV